MKNGFFARVASLVVAVIALTMVVFGLSEMSPPYLAFRPHLIFCAACVAGTVLGWRGRLDGFTFFAMAISAAAVGSAYILVITRVGRSILPEPLEYVLLAPIPIVIALGIAGISGIAVAATYNLLHGLDRQTQGA